MTIVNRGASSNRLGSVATVRQVRRRRSDSRRPLHEPADFSRCRVLALGLDVRCFALKNRIDALEDWHVTIGLKPVEEVPQPTHSLTYQEIVNAVQRSHGGKAMHRVARELEEQLVAADKELVAVEKRMLVVENSAVAMGYKRLQ
jgi:hypothetical protein